MSLKSKNMESGFKVIKWKEKYETGITTIDDQHRKLFELTYSAYELLKNNFYTDKYDRIVEILEELKNYTIFHFKSEEEYMLSINYKKFLSHKIEHDTLVEKINNIDLKLVDQEQDKHIMDILNFLIDWIDNHILEKDLLITSNS